MLFMAGDVILSQGMSRLSRAIRWAQSSRREEETLVNHAILVVRPGTVPYWTWIVESDLKVRIGHLGEFHSKDLCWCFRPRNVSQNSLDHIAQVAQNRVGEKYGFFQLIPQLIDNKLLGGKIVTRKLVRSSGRAICSRLVAEAYATRGYDFGVPGYAADPDQIYDFCQDNQDKYKLVWTGYPTQGVR